MIAPTDLLDHSVHTGAGGNSPTSWEIGSSGFGRRSERSDSTGTLILGGPDSGCWVRFRPKRLPQPKPTSSRNAVGMQLPDIGVPELVIVVVVAAVSFVVWRFGHAIKEGMQQR